MKLYKTVLRNPIIYLIIGLFFFSCSDKDKTPKEEIVAKVGGRIITKDEFKSSYEFSVHLFRRGTNSRKTYLNYMVNELLVANEGFTHGFNKKRYVTSRIANRSNNNLLEAFYTKHIYNKVTIPEEKIIDVLKKSTIKFRLLILPTPSLEKAAEAYDVAIKSDLGDYIDTQINKLEIKNANRKNFETDWMDYLEMPPEMFAKIQNLEIGKPSKPIPYNNGYAIFQIINLERKAIKSDELIYGSKRKKIKERLFNIESDRIVHELMDSILTPLNVKISSRIIGKLVKPLYAWVYAGIPDRGSIVYNLNSVSDTSKNYLKELKELLPEKLYTTTEGTVTVEDYFNYMNYHRKIINLSKNPYDLENRLYAEVGTMIKNKKFISIAKKEGFEDSIKIKNDLKVWEQKFTYDLFRKNLIREITVTEEEMEKYFKERWRELRISNVDTTRFYKYEDDVYNAILFEKHSKLLETEISKLKKKYPVVINENVLNSIELNDGPKSAETSLFVIKKFSGERLVPTADMKWLSY